jgi:hypothetical protein
MLNPSFAEVPECGQPLHLIRNNVFQAQMAIPSDRPLQEKPDGSEREKSSGLLAIISPIPACKLGQKRNTSCSMLPQVRSRPRPLKFVTAPAILALFPSRLRNQTILRKHPKTPPIIPRKSPEGEKF